MTENWRPVAGHPGYAVSDLGRVKSLSRTIINRGRPAQLRERILALAPTPGGKLAVCLSNHGQKVRLVHQLVLEAFVGPCPFGQECLHANDIGTDNRLENLRWGTRRENVLDQVRNGRHHKARMTKCGNGHEYTPENTRIRRSGARACRQCERDRHKGQGKWAS